jgi:ABC-type molybdate transport system permease subunit
MTKILGKSVQKNERNLIITGLATAVLFVILGTFVFTTSLETLDVQAEKLGVTGENIVPAPFPEYTLPGFENVWGGTLLGIGSTLGIFGVTLALANVLKKKTRSQLIK